MILKWIISCGVFNLTENILGSIREVVKSLFLYYKRNSHISKILWFQKNRPHLVKKAYKIVSIKEYILYKLFGQYLIDITDASTTGYFNINTFEWDNEILKNVLSLSSHMFGEPVDCTYILKGLKKTSCKCNGSFRRHTICDRFW